MKIVERSCIKFEDLKVGDVFHDIGDKNKYFMKILPNYDGGGCLAINTVCLNSTYLYHRDSYDDVCKVECELVVEE